MFILFEYFITLFFHFKFFLLPISEIFPLVNFLLGINESLAYGFFQSRMFGFRGGSAVIQILFGFVNLYKVLDDP